MIRVKITNNFEQLYIREMSTFTLKILKFLLWLKSEFRPISKKIKEFLKSDSQEACFKQTFSNGEEITIILQRI